MTINLNSALSHFREHQKYFLDELKTLVKIPSISFDGFPATEVVRSAEAVASLMKKSKLENVQILSVADGTHPYVYADWLHAPGKPTILLYAHHDVQPTGRDHLWKTPPFEPTEVNDRLFGRGTADDKAGILVHVGAIVSYLETSGKLPVNVKLIIEGEEEIGSVHLSQFIQKYRSLLKSDAMILTDTENFDTGKPAITVALRGLLGFEIELRSLKSSKHSGMVGGPVPDPTMALCKMLSQLTDTEGRICVPGVWDEVREVSEVEKNELDSIPLTISEFRSNVGVLPNSKLLPAKDGVVHPLKQIWREPSLAINAFEASSKTKVSNIINDTAWAKFGVRIVADMNAKRTSDLVVNYLRQITPWGLECNIKTEVNGGAWSIKPVGRYFDATRTALEKGYGVKPLMTGCGGSIPFVEPLSKELGGVPAVLIGVEDPFTNAHSENESMSISDFYKAIASMIYLYDELGKR